jgi:hypothetical protein
MGRRPLLLLLALLAAYWEASRIDPREIVFAVAGCAIGVLVTRVVAVARGMRAPMLLPASPGP